MLKVNFNRKVGIELVKIYGFCGVMGSGKGYRCEQLKKEGFVQIDFADAYVIWFGKCSIGNLKMQRNMTILKKDY